MTADLQSNEESVPPDAGPAALRNHSTSTRRALTLLEFVATFEGHPVGATLSDLTAGTRLPRGTVLRLIAPLVERGYLERDEDTRRYRLGSTLAYLGGVYLERLDLTRLVRPTLRAMMEASGETAYLAALNAGQMIFLDKVESPARVRLHSRLGSRVLAHCTAVGKAALAFSEPAVVDQVIRAGLPAQTANTLTHRAKLLADLEQTRERGYSVDNGENEPGVRCVGAPILARDGVIGALSVSGPDGRVTRDRVPELGALVAGAARGVSIRLGARLP